MLRGNNTHAVSVAHSKLSCLSFVIVKINGVLGFSGAVEILDF